MPECFHPENLDTFPQPRWNSSTSISEALTRVLDADCEEASWDAYNKLLYALGNNHAGTYFPVALAVLPAVDHILRNGSPWAQHSVLNALIDLCGSFEPETGHELFRGSSLSAQLKHGISSLVLPVETVANNDSIASQSAKELLESIYEQ